MLIRTKSGEIQTCNANVLCKQSLLDYLGVKKEAAGLQKVLADVELIAPVPIIREQVTNNSEQRQEGFAWLLSTFDLDRYGERIDPAGWDFKRFMNNPVVEWAHRYDIPAIGKIEGLTVDDDGLHGFVFFNDKEYDAFGWSIGERVKAGVLKAGSVGFRPIEIEIPSKEDGKDGTTLIFRKQELLEFSICNVPANPFALTKNKEQITNNKGDSGITTDYWGGLFQGTSNNEQITKEEGSNATNF